MMIMPGMVTNLCVSSTMITDRIVLFSPKVEKWAGMQKKKETKKFCTKYQGYYSYRSTNSIGFLGLTRVCIENHRILSIEIAPLFFSFFEKSSPLTQTVKRPVFCKIRKDQQQQNAVRINNDLLGQFRMDEEW